MSSTYKGPPSKACPIQGAAPITRGAFVRGVIVSKSWRTISPGTLHPILPEMVSYDMAGAHARLYKITRSLNRPTGVDKYQ